MLKDGADLDRKPLPTVAAFVSPVVGEMIDAGGATMWAERAIAPADRTEMIDAGLLVRKHGDHLVQAGELLDHSAPRLRREGPNLRSRRGSSTSDRNSLIKYPRYRGELISRGNVNPLWFAVISTNSPQSHSTMTDEVHLLESVRDF